MWTLDYEADIASDLSAFHRIDDPMTISGPRFFALAVRLSAYSGVMAARAAKLHEDERDNNSGTPYTGTAAQTSHVTDAAALALLEADGWAERTREGDA